MFIHSCCPILWILNFSSKIALVKSATINITPDITDPVDVNSWIVDLYEAKSLEKEDTSIPTANIGASIYDI